MTIFLKKEVLQVFAPKCHWNSIIIFLVTAARSVNADFRFEEWEIQNIQFLFEVQLQLVDLIRYLEISYYKIGTFIFLLR